MQAKINKYLLSAIVLISCTMFIWTLTTIININNTQIPTAISAFNG